MIAVVFGIQYTIYDYALIIFGIAAGLVLYHHRWSWTGDLIWIAFVILVGVHLKTALIAERDFSAWNKFVSCLGFVESGIFIAAGHFARYRRQQRKRKEIIHELEEGVLNGQAPFVAIEKYRLHRRNGKKQPAVGGVVDLNGGSD